MPEQDLVNGVDASKLAETMTVIKTNPEIAKFTFRAKNKWVNGTHGRTEIKDFYGAGQEDTSRQDAFVMEGDEPAVLLGENQAPNAQEALLHALGSCLSTTFMYYAAMRHVNVHELSLDLEGDMDVHGILGVSDRIRSGFEEIRVTFHVKADAPKEQIEELCNLAQKRSPVFDAVTSPVPVSARVDAMEDTGGRAERAA